MGSAEAIFEAKNIRKSFGPVNVLEDVNIRLFPGQVVGLVGNNGAGKSTLIKILTGYHAADSGEILMDGKPVRFASPADARQRGIETVYQDLGLINHLPIYRNVFLKREILTRVLGIPFLNDREMRRQTVEYLQQIKVNVPDVKTEVSLLSGGQRQAIAVARSIFTSPKVLILDEPLAAMGAREGRMILDLVVDLKKTRDTAILLIAHNYAQVFEICDRVSWLSHGQVVFDKAVGETSVEELTELVMSDYRAG